LLLIYNENVIMFILEKKKMLFWLLFGKEKGW